MSEDEAEKLLTILELNSGQDSPKLKGFLIEIPTRGKDIPTNDPTFHRLQEILDVYGTSIKSCIHELCGDGIMSAIDCKINVEKKQDEAGNDRVVLTIDGKFLKYVKW